MSAVSNNQNCLDASKLSSDENPRMLASECFLQHAALQEKATYLNTDVINMELQTAKQEAGDVRKKKTAKESCRAKRASPSSGRDRIAA